jgi:hypothetical protein
LPTAPSENKDQHVLARPAGRVAAPSFSTTSPAAAFASSTASPIASPAARAGRTAITVSPAQITSKTARARAASH